MGKKKREEEEKEGGKRDVEERNGVKKYRNETKQNTKSEGRWEWKEERKKENTRFDITTGWSVKLGTNEKG